MYYIYTRNKQMIDTVPYSKMSWLQKVVFRFSEFPSSRSIGNTIHRIVIYMLTSAVIYYCFFHGSTLTKKGQYIKDRGQSIVDASLNYVQFGVNSSKHTKYYTDKKNDSSYYELISNKLQEILNYITSVNLEQLVLDGPKRKGTKRPHKIVPGKTKKTSSPKSKYSNSSKVRHRAKSADGTRNLIPHSWEPIGGPTHVDETDDPVKVAIVLCHGTGLSFKEKYLEEARILLKTLTMTSKHRIDVYCIVDSIGTFKAILDLVKSWYIYHRRQLRLIPRLAIIPNRNSDSVIVWKHGHYVCADVKMFIPDVLYDVDKAIVLDLDFVWFHPIEELWNELVVNNPDKMMGHSPNSFNRIVPHPSSKTLMTGFYASMYLLNLQKMRDMEGGWFKNVLEARQDLIDNSTVFKGSHVYKDIFGFRHIQDQLVMNWMYVKHRHEIFSVPCQWNFIEYFCWRKDTCPDAERTGVYASQNLYGHEFKPGTEIGHTFRCFRDVKLKRSKKMALIEVIDCIKNQAPAETEAECGYLDYRALSLEKLVTD